MPIVLRVKLQRSASVSWLGKHEPPLWLANLASAPPTCLVVAGRSDMAENPEMADNAGRVVHEAEIDRVLEILAPQLA